MRKKPAVACFTGCTFPRKDLDSHKLSYAQYVLTLFKPWRDLQELCSDGDWESKLEEWFVVPSEDLSCCPSWVHRMLANIHSLHEGEDKRKELRDENKRSRLNVLDEREGRDYEVEEGYDGFDGIGEHNQEEEEDEEEVTDDMDFAPYISSRKGHEVAFAQAAIDSMRRAGRCFF